LIGSTSFVQAIDDVFICHQYSVIIRTIEAFVSTIGQRIVGAKCATEAGVVTSERIFVCRRRFAGTGSYTEWIRRKHCLDNRITHILYRLKSSHVTVHSWNHCKVHLGTKSCSHFLFVSRNATTRRYMQRMRRGKHPQRR